MSIKKLCCNIFSLGDFGDNFIYGLIAARFAALLLLELIAFLEIIVFLCLLLLFIISFNLFFVFLFIFFRLRLVLFFCVLPRSS